MFVTGSQLHADAGAPAVRRQVELMRAIFRAGVPCFGSCRGLQIATVAAGGEVGLSPRGREVGFARNVAPTPEGRAHPLLADRPAAFTALSTHADAVLRPAPGTTVLASSAMNPVQAAVIRHEGGLFWGTQYHPELPLDELAAALDRQRATLIEEGFFADAAAHAATVADLSALHGDPGRRDLAWRYGLDAQVLDAELRTSELRRFMAHRVRRARAMA